MKRVGILARMLFCSRRTTVPANRSVRPALFAHRLTAMKNDDYADPDDMFSDTRMTFGEHIEDLRTHLLRAIYGFFLGFIIAIPLGRPVLNFISAPVEDQLTKFNDRYDAVKRKELSDMAADGRLDTLPPLRLTIIVTDVDLEPL